jgi:hypothetical protein
MTANCPSSLTIRDGMPSGDATGAVVRAKTRPPVGTIGPGVSERVISLSIALPLAEGLVRRGVLP